MNAVAFVSLDKTHCSDQVKSWSLDLVILKVTLCQLFLSHRYLCYELLFLEKWNKTLLLLVVEKLAIAPALVKTGSSL